MQELNNAQAANRSTAQQQVATVPWVSNETKALASVAGRLKYALTRLDKRISGRRIHDARTALKRWNAVWSVLTKDGWHFDDDAIDDLNKLFKKLGDARDYDRFLSAAEELDISKELVHEWKKSRKHARQKVKSKLKKIDVNDVCDALNGLVEREPSVVALHVAHSTAADESSNQHIGSILQQQEERVHKAALAPASAKDYHAVRKEVKNLGYLLEELTGKGNKQIAQIEEKLGDLHDLDKLEPLLNGDETNLTALVNLQARREQLLSELANLDDQLRFAINPTQADAA